MQRIASNIRSKLPDAIGCVYGFGVEATLTIDSFAKICPPAPFGEPFAVRT